MRRYVLAILIVTQIMICAEKLAGQQAASDQRPQVLLAVAPPYPAIAAGLAVSGTVVVGIEIDRQGVVSSASVLSGFGVLATAAERSARRWVFSATDAVAKRRSVKLTFEYKLMPRGTPSDRVFTSFKPPYELQVVAVIPDVVDSVNRDPSLKSRSSAPGTRKP